MMNNKKILILILLIILVIIHKYYFISEPFEYNENRKIGFSKIYNNFITDEECDKLINIAKDNFINSTLVHETENNFVDKRVRSSKNYYFTKSANPIIYNIEKKVSEILNVPIENLEPIQMVKYDEDEQYLPHYDYIKEELNQRTHTFIIYLNTLEENVGGSTNFVKYNIKIHPEKGKAICFRNIDSYGRLNSMSLHGGEKVKGSKNSKYILTIWIRKNKY